MGLARCQAGGQEEMRLLRRGTQVTAWAGPAGAPVMIGTVPLINGNTGLTIGLYSADAGTGLAVLVNRATIGLAPAP